MAKQLTRAKREQTADYKHAQKAVQRPDVGVQDQFQAKKPPKTYRFDSSLDPELSWDESRERALAEWLLGLVERCATEGEAVVFKKPQVWAGGGIKVESLKAVAGLLQSLSKPFLNWAGKAERSEISVPTVPLFVHERHSTKAILEGIESKRAKGSTLNLFGDPEPDISDRLDAYQHKGPWRNRMVLGDSLQVMNSLLEFEGLGGQVQMIYMDPPYGVKFGSNFQPFVRKRDVKHGGDEAMTREPEMVKAYRDTWELGLHSYLTYLRDRLFLAKELLHESGSVFVQISEANLHLVRSLMDEVFGAHNFARLITFKTTGGQADSFIASVSDYIVWYARDIQKVKARILYSDRQAGDEGAERYNKLLLPDGTERSTTPTDYANPPTGGRLFRLTSLVSQGYRSTTSVPWTFKGKTFDPGKQQNWKTSLEGLARLAASGRIGIEGSRPAYRRYLDDFAFVPLTGIWTDTQSNFAGEKLYAVQTALKVVQRCMLMCTDPGDLVLDPTCGSGSTAYAAEQWGRRWITCDTSRVPSRLRDNVC